MPWKKTDTGIVHFVSTKAGLWAEVVSEETHLEVPQLLALAKFGSIYLNDSRVFENCEIKNDDYLRMHTNPRRYPRLDLKNNIVLETDDLMIVNKPSGLPCHPTVDNMQENLWLDLQSQLDKTLFPTHRLDVPTSGLIVLTKNPSAQLQFQDLLKEKKVNKIYQALVPAPGPELGLHEHYMEKTKYAPKTILDKPRSQTQICQLKILKKEILKNTARLEIELITGRTHQIRAQLSFLGFPILGDTLYAHGSEVSYQDEKIELRCISLQFPWNGKLLNCNLDQDLDLS